MSVLVMGGIINFYNGTKQIQVSKLEKQQQFEREHLRYTMPRPSTQIVRKTSNTSNNAPAINSTAKVAQVAPLAPLTKKPDKKKKETKKKVKTEEKKLEVSVVKTPNKNQSNRSYRPSNTTTSVYTVGPDETPKKNDNLRFDEWKSKLLDAPTAELISELVRQFSSDEISASMYYELISLMMVSDRLVVREFGLMALTATPSVQSFLLLAAAYEVESNSSLRTEMTTLLNSYSNKSKFYVLAAALRSADKSAIRQSAQLVEFSAMKKIDELQAKKNQPKTKNDFLVFISILKELVNKKDREVSSAALSALNQVLKIQDLLS
jgi:hypothetical protein